ncbi:hypothetical protein K0M31_011498 [Melipona bicolor]|uniref:Uncharacterized protein n=1 Tax=Melipona bicolor TaxID=60889 RepID=A0AA40G9W4_9HYME|nr:hypothetical protein K0M31_011498 [Melipona bicolor]
MKAQDATAETSPRASFWLRPRPPSNRLPKRPKIQKVRLVRLRHPGGTINRLWNWIFGKWVKEKNYPAVVLDRGSASGNQERWPGNWRSAGNDVSRFPPSRFDEGDLVKVPLVTGSL